MLNRHGFTLIEVMIVACIFGILIAGVYGLMASTTEVYDDGLIISSLQTRARTALDIIADEFQGAIEASIAPVPTAPFGSTNISFMKNTGYDGADIIWDDSTAIWLDNMDNVVYLQLNGGTPVRLARDVRPLLEGEESDGLDNNGNGLIDEEGLSFELDNSKMTMRLSLEVTDDKGRTHTVTEQTSLTFRN